MRKLENGHKINDRGFGRQIILVFFSKFPAGGGEVGCAAIPKISAPEASFLSTFKKNSLESHHPGTWPFPGAEV